MNDSATVMVGMASHRLVEFLVALELDKLPAQVVRDARMRLLDTLGCGLYGAAMPWSRMIAGMIEEEKSQGRATVYGSRDSVAPARAALANGTATHGIELDDIAPGHCHPGTAVVPAVLAVAEQHELPGERVLLGLIAGYEAASRTGSAIGEVGWSFHLPAIVGAIGAAAGCGVALGMTRDQVLRAIGIAASSAAGIRTFVQGSGGMVKRLHAGRAAEAGVLANLLAARGFTAPLAALDGKFGLLEAFGEKHRNPQALADKLGERYIVSRIWTKMFPCCGGIHAMAQALHALRDEHHISHESVQRVRVGVNQRAMDLHTESAPVEMMAAQYSMPFTAATALIGDARDPRAYDGAALTNPAVCALARKVELYLDPEIHALYPRHGARVTLTLDNGRALEAAVHDAKGTAANPCTEEELRAKFQLLASAALSDKAVEEVSGLVGSIETMRSIAPLSRALRSGMR